MGTESNGNLFYMENGMGMENFYSVQSMLGNANNTHTNNNNGSNANENVVVNSNGNGSGNRWSNLLAPRDTNEQQHQHIHNTTANISNSFASHQRNFVNYGNMACYQRIYNENGFNLTTNAQNYHQYHNNTHQHQQPKQYYSSGLKNFYAIIFSSYRRGRLSYKIIYLILFIYLKRKANSQFVNALNFHILWN